MNILSNKNVLQSHFQLHPRAIQALDFYQKITKKFYLPSLDPATISEIFEANRTYYATRITKEEIYIFSGFEYLQFTPHNIPHSKPTVIICNYLAPEEIERRAWQGVFRSLLSSIDPSIALAEIQENLSLFSSSTESPILKSIHLTDQALAAFSQASRQTIAKQKLKKKIVSSNTQPSTERSIFESIK